MNPSLRQDPEMEEHLHIAKALPLGSNFDWENHADLLSCEWRNDACENIDEKWTTGERTNSSENENSY